MSEFRKIGRELCKGVLDIICTWIVVGILLSLAWSFFIQPVDDSDVSRYDRSGLKILTDNKTGQQYLTTSKGGLVVRSE